MVELQRLQTADVRYAISRSCGDIVEALILLHCPEKMSMRSCAEKRSLYAREPARSASAPPRKRWFHKAPLERVHSQMTVCDELTRKLVGAITTWHDIHSNLLRLSIDKSCSDISISDQSSISSDSDESANGADYANSNAARFSLSNPELTSMQIKQMFPELSEHWRRSLGLGFAWTPIRELAEEQLIRDQTYAGKLGTCYVNRIRSEERRMDCGTPCDNLGTVIGTALQKRRPSDGRL
ncbi:hypothetical protein RB195_019284 [Necator americanus]|uniref:Uncharacterized protein n=1 Tax=Necator americanus TaxID=51031 RepID=A0ABR1CDG2_NECAM